MSAKNSFLACGISAAIWARDDYSDANRSSLLTDKESYLLKKKFNFSSVSSFKDRSQDILFSTLKSGNDLRRKSVDFSNLDLTKITEVVWLEGNFSYFIPFQDNSSVYLVISSTSLGSLDTEKAVVIENDVDSDGNGTITTIYSDGIYVQSFINGMEQNIVGKSAFRTCFDNAYDTICDGFVGCVAWYSNPTVPLLAAAYCELNT